MEKLLQIQPRLVFTSDRTARNKTIQNEIERNATQRNRNRILHRCSQQPFRYFSFRKPNGNENVFLTGTVHTFIHEVNIIYAVTTYFNVQFTEVFVCEEVHQNSQGSHLHAESKLKATFASLFSTLKNPVSPASLGL